MCVGEEKNLLGKNKNIFKNKNIYLSFSHQHLYITVFTSVYYSKYECICICVGGHTIQVNTQYTMLYVRAPNRGLNDLYA